MKNANSGRLDGTTQIIAYDGSVGVTSVFGPQTRQVRLVANSACNVHVYEADGSSTAASTDPYLPAHWVQYATVTPGQKISAIKAGTNGLVTSTAGTLWVTEVPT